MPDYIIPPAGVSAASFFTPGTIVDPAKPPAMLADDLDVATGELRSLFSRVHPVDAAVVEQLRLHRGSGAAVEDEGTLFRKFDKVYDNTAAAVEDEIRRALKPLVDRRDIRIDTVAVESGVDDPTMVASVGEYTNLHTDERANLLRGGGR